MGTLKLVWCGFFTPSSPVDLFCLGDIQQTAKFKIFYVKKSPVK